LPRLSQSSFSLKLLISQSDQFRSFKLTELTEISRARNKQACLTSMLACLVIYQASKSSIGLPIYQASQA
jgi:hypothetical protein